MRSRRWFSVALLLLAPMAMAADRPAGPITEEGAIDGADFRIDIPKNWNGGLVMYAHGYAMVTMKPQFNLDMVKAAEPLGLAVAQSRYSRQGWAAEEGILETEELRKHFVEKYGSTSPTIIAGHSQGGQITYGTIEKYPEAYDGALPMCGVATSAIQFFKERTFDMRLLFDYYFPGVPGSAVEFPDGTYTFAKASAKVRELIAAEPEKAEAFAKMVNVSSAKELPTVIAFWSEILREMTERAGGNCFDNMDTIYSGSPDDAKLNKEIPRHAADPKAAAYLREWVTLTGKISDPVLALHTLVDDLIPPTYANMYGEKTVLAGTSDLYAQSWIDRAGHCAFNTEETTEALRQLLDWIKTGKRPTPGDWTKNP